MVSAARLARIKAMVKQGLPAFDRLRDNVASPGEVGGYGSSAENLATMYLLTGEARYAKQAFAWAAHTMANADVRFDSYLDYGHHMVTVATVLDFCRPALDPAQRKQMADYLNRWTHEAWFDNQGSGWGLEDPGNNYYYNYLMGLAFSGYALRGEKHPKADDYIAKVERELEGRVMPYLQARGAGGGWSEGANYGELSKQLLLTTLALIASQGGPNYFERAPFFTDLIYYALHQVQPDHETLNPSGDLARDATMPITPYDRDYVQIATLFGPDAEARAYGAWYLTEVIPSVLEGGFSWRGGLYKDVLFAIGDEVQPKAPKAKLDRFHLAAGTGFVNVRSAWGSSSATSFTLSAASIIDQSHQHHDVGSFVLFKNGWQAADAVTFSHSGLPWEAGAHNMVHVEGQQRLFGLDGGGLVRHHRGEGFFFAEIDAAYAFKRYHEGKNYPLVTTHRRDLVYLEPDTVVTYDHVVPREGRRVSLRMHFPKKPIEVGGAFLASHARGGLAFKVLVGGKSQVRPDDDLAEGPSASFRAEVAPKDPKDARYVAVAQVADQRPPPLRETKRLPSSDEVYAILAGDDVVVFRIADTGSLTSFDYEVPALTKRRHVMLHLDPDQRYTVATKTQGGRVEVSVSVGGDVEPTPEGVLFYRQR